MTVPAAGAATAMVEATYRGIEDRVARVRARLGRPLTYAEKLLFGHLDDPDTAELIPAESFLKLRPDRVALHDVTGQTAILQFMQAGRTRTAIPATVHCDHLVVAHQGAGADTRTAVLANREIYDFLRSASARYGLGFWGPGAGIIHQVILENYAFPGLMLIGTDSHTANAGGLGAFASGVGGADAVDVMAGLAWELLFPQRIGVRLTGALRGWAAPKDVILRLAGLLTVSGATNAVLEYFGPGAESLSATGKATICNMGAELGATTSLFPYDDRMAIYLNASARAELATLADRYRHLLTADDEVVAHPELHFDRVIEIDLGTLEPHLVGPNTPDLARPISEIAAAVSRESYPERLSAALIGSCTNSSYEDLSRAADIAKQAVEHGLKAAVELLVTPGSEAINATSRRDGQMALLQAAGARVMANACGPCIGQWRRDDIRKGEVNAIVTTFNRNFPARNDANRATLNFIGSPELVMALSLAGSLTFNPLTDTLEGAEGNAFRLEPPGPAPEVPVKGFIGLGSGYEPPPEDGTGVSVAIHPSSKRLQALSPFPAWDGRDFHRLHLLVKVRGKCTTDHISPAGPWLRFRGHLERLSDNLFLGAVNAFSGAVGEGLNQNNGTCGSFSSVARAYKAVGEYWIVVGDWNYGEGSSREHAAMSPRLLGCRVVMARSFARIHETNLKKQGVLPLRFADPNDYDLFLEGDRISITGLRDMRPGQRVTGIIHHCDRADDVIELGHSLTAEQIGWFRAGSALNALSA